MQVRRLEVQCVEKSLALDQAHATADELAMELEARKGEKLVDPLIYFDEDEGVYKAQAREVQTEA